VPSRLLLADPGPGYGNGWKVCVEKPFTLKFCVESDGLYSDEDGLYATSCGAFAVDDVWVVGGGVNDLQDFEAGDGYSNTTPWFDDVRFGVYGAPVTGIPGRPGKSPATALLGFAPNPLRGGASGTITFTLAEAGPARVEIFDLAGRLVSTVFEARGSAGENRVRWDGRDDTGRLVTSGIYFYRLAADARTFARKITVLSASS
jgi:hypothetical protein